MSQRPLNLLVRYFKEVAGRELLDWEDRRLLDAFWRQRDEAAFAALVRRHGPMVLELCRRVLHHEQDAEDAFQATFLVLSKKVAAIRAADALASWLYKVAFRICLRLRSRAARQQRAEAHEEPARPALEPAADLSWRDVRAILDEELAALPERYRAPLVCCYLLGKTRDEVADELGWTVGTVKGRLERGRDMLRRRLARRGLALSSALLASLLVPAIAAAVPARLATATVAAAVRFVSPAALADTVTVRVLELATEFTLPARGALLFTAALLLTLGVLALGAAVWPPGSQADAGAQAAVPALPAGAGADAQPPPFAACACGLDEIVAAKYASTPRWWLSGLHLVDLDGDGRLDFFMSAHGPGGAVAALNDGKGRFVPAPGKYPASEVQLAYDLDEDGKLDLSCTFQDGGSQWWLNKSRPGLLQFEPTKISRDTHMGRRQALVDIDRDGKVDWLRGTPNQIAFDLADGQGSFRRDAFTLRIGDTLRAEVLCLPADLDGDGAIDLVAEWGHYGYAKGTSRIYHGDGKLSFRDATAASGLSGKDTAIKGVADVNHDGHPDLVLLEDMRPEIYLNDGAGRFTKKPGAITGLERATRPSKASWGAAIMTDFDNDGKGDLIWNGRHFLWLLRGNGDGTFRYVTRDWGIKDLSAAAVDDGLCFGDFDADGMLDVAGYTQINERRTFALYRNQLPPQRWLRVRPIGAAGNAGAAGAKIRLYAPGTQQLLWHDQVVINNSQSAPSYYAFAQTERHFGLGPHSAADVEVEFYPSGKKALLRKAGANMTVAVREP